MPPTIDYEALMKLAKECKPVERMISTAIPTMDGWCTLEKARFMAGYILSTKPKLVVELGTYAGRSFLPILWAIRENKTGKAVAAKHREPAQAH